MLPFLSPVVDFTDIWHASPWALADLADALKAELTYLAAGHGILGASTDTGLGVRTISVQQRLEGTLLGTAVVCHEGGHLLTQIVPTARTFCNSRGVNVRTEMPAWLAAGLLVVSAEQSWAYRRGEVSLPDLARVNLAPAELIEVGISLRDPGAQTYGVALALWMAAMAYQVVRLLPTQRTGRGLARST